MIDFRLYRLAFAPAALAFAALMFSLAGPPEALEPAVSPAAFDGTRATLSARHIASIAPQRTPGSEDDEAIADLVAGRFSEVPAGSVSEQSFDSTHEGDAVTLRTVLLTLPGDAGRVIVVVAARAAERGPGAASSAAATGVLIELAEVLAVAGHDATFVLASTGGTDVSGAGARALLEELPERDAVEAVISISQPGSADLRQPFVVDSSTSDRSASAQLVRTAELAVATQAGVEPDAGGAFAQLARLAIPAGLGGQAPLIGAGIDAVAISSAGETPLSPSRDGTDAVSSESVGGFGRAVQSVVVAVDGAAAPLEHGPRAYVEASANLVPGWALSLLGLGLILAAAVAATDAVARAARTSGGLAGALRWALSLGLPFLGALTALYGLALVGVVPRPTFPFDPGLFELGTRSAISFALIVLAAALTVWLVRPWRRGRGPLVAGLGAVSAASALVIWLANPYLGLLVSPAAHVWLLASTPRGRPGALIASAAAALSLLPLGLAVTSVAGELDLGGDAPWTLALMVADGQIGFVTTLSACLLAGCLVGAGVVAGGGRATARSVPAPGVDRGSPQSRPGGSPSDERRLDASPIV